MRIRAYSGGSAGGRRWVQLGVAGLEAAADGLGPWLLEQGLDPATCLWLDPLPLHHVSGLMPWLRARRLGGLKNTHGTCSSAIHRG